MFALEIVTLGIYRLYWLIKTRREMMDKDTSIKILNPLILVAPIVLVILSIAPMVLSIIHESGKVPSYCSVYTSNYSYSSDNSYSSSNYIPSECQSNPAGWTIALFFIGILLIFPTVLIWLWGYAQGVEKITHGKMSFAVTLIVLFAVPDGIDILLVQDAFNKTNLPESSHTATPSAAPATVATAELPTTTTPTEEPTDPTPPKVT